MLIFFLKVLIFEDTVESILYSAGKCGAPGRMNSTVGVTAAAAAFASARAAAGAAVGTANALFAALFCSIDIARGGKSDDN